MNRSRFLQIAKGILEIAILSGFHHAALHVIFQDQSSDTI
jgi:hypothetical protein